MLPRHFFALRTAIFGMLTFHLAQVAILAFIYAVTLMTTGQPAAIFFVTGMVAMVLVVAAGEETARGLSSAL
ncbi:MAG: hypothetical protein GEU80_01580 [Dehalococcoidia bacterium]|nr:hypothetical protein [Dehalococcoidia bacterium]